MKYINYLLIALLIGFVASCSSGDDEGPVGPEGPEQPGDGGQTSSGMPKKELRGVWMATVWGIDWPQDKYDAFSQKKLYTDYLDLMKSCNMNAVFFQIRGMADAFYESQYEPWSKNITGQAGVKPTYDLMNFLIEEAHKRDIQFHAWINPYRIATRGSASQGFPVLDKKIPAEWTKDYNKIRIYNPALPEVQQRIVDIVKEILSKYDVDGIHMDDYFYPALESGEQMKDEEEYKKYGSGFKSIDDFRRNNVNVVIQNIQKAVKETKPDVVFSVSPASDFNNNYHRLFADAKTWAEKGWVDVMIPQLYHLTGTTETSFNLRLNLWSQYTYDNHLLVGYGIYKFGDKQYGTHYQNSDDLKRQFDYARTKSKVEGGVHFSAKDLKANNVGVSDVIRKEYKKKVLPPYLGLGKAQLPEAPNDLRLNNGKMTWSAVGGAVKYAIYKSNGKEYELLDVVKEMSYDMGQKGTFVVTAVSKVNAESLPSNSVSR